MCLIRQVIGAPSINEQKPVLDVSGASDTVTDKQRTMPDVGDAMAVSGASDSLGGVLDTERVDSDCALLREAVALSLLELAPSSGGLDTAPQAKQKTPTKKGTKNGIVAAASKKGMKQATANASPQKGKALQSSEVGTQTLLCVLCCVVSFASSVTMLQLQDFGVCASGSV